MSFHVSPMCICVLKVKKRCSREIDIEIRTIFDIEHKHIYSMKMMKKTSSGQCVVTENVTEHDIHGRRVYMHTANMAYLGLVLVYLNTRNRTRTL